MRTQRLFCIYAIVLNALLMVNMANAGQIGGITEDYSRWQEVAGLPEGCYDLACGVLNGKLYAIGGAPYVRTNVYCFDGTNWSETTGLLRGTRQSACGVLSGALYVLGGYASGVVITNVYCYDGTNWNETAGLPAGRNKLAVGVLNNMLYAVNGNGSDSIVKTNIYCFDGTNWSEIVGFIMARKNLTCGVLAGALYAVGGEDWSGIHTNVFRYDGTNWCEITGLPQPRSELAGGVLNGGLYAVDGTFNNAICTNVYRYDGTSWNEVVGLPAARRGLACGVLNGAIYALGGTVDGIAGYTNVYRFPALVNYPPSGVEPSSGAVTGGYQVVISGATLCNGDLADVTNVTLCGIPAAAIDSVAISTQIVVTAAPGTPRQGDVVVYSREYGVTVGLNKFTYIGPVMTVLGTNSEVIASGTSASAALGTDFGNFNLYDSPVVHILAITNSGNAALTFSGWATNGINATAFSISDLGGSIKPGEAHNFTVSFNPYASGVLTAVLVIACNATQMEYVVNMRGTVIPSISEACADYDGDGKADPAIYDEATGTWRIKLSSRNYQLMVTAPRGLDGLGLVSVSADYDGDGQADPAVYQELNGRWITWLSSLNYTLPIILVRVLGGAGYSGVSADYDGDGRADPAVYQRDNGDWEILLSSENYSFVDCPGLLGGSGYIAVPADYDGDGKADPAIYEESNGVWTFLLSSVHYLWQVTMTRTLGGAGYLPVPADYDGDGFADPAVKSAYSNEWIVMFSSGAYVPVHLTITFE